MKLVLIDSPETLQAVSEAGLLRNKSHVVASTSEGYAACINAGVSCTPIHAFLDYKNLVKDGMNNYRNIAKFCMSTDEMASKLSRDLSSRGIRPLQYEIMKLKIFSDACLLPLIFLNSAIRALNPEGIVLRSGAGAENPIKSPNPYAVIWERCLRASRGGTSVEEVEVPTTRKEWGFDLAGLGDRVRTSLICRICSLMGSWGYFLFSFGHDVPLLFASIARRGGRIVRFVAPAPTNEQMAEGERIWRALLPEIEKDHPFQVDGISMLPIVAEHFLMPLFCDELPKGIAAYDAAKETTANKDIRLSLTGHINVGIVLRSAMEGARKANAPLVTYQEGAGYGSIIAPIYDISEVVSGDLFLSYGDGNLEHYRSLGMKTKRFLTVGSAFQWDIRRKFYRKGSLKKYPKKVMYVGTANRSSGGYFPNNGGISTRYLETQKKIFDMMISLPKDVDTVVRIHPLDNAAKILLNSPLYKRLKIEKRPMHRAMKGVDLFILDFPSTTLMNALHTSAHIFVLIEEGVSGLTSEQQRRLSTRARIFNNFDDLDQAINLGMDEGLLPMTGEDYLRAYVLPDDVSPRTKSVEIIARIATSDNPTETAINGTL